MKTTNLLSQLSGLSLDDEMPIGLLKLAKKKNQKTSPAKVFDFKRKQENRVAA